MKFQIKKRRLLVIILSLCQLVCLLTGLLIFSQQLKRELTGLMRSKFQSNSQHASVQMAELIRQMGIKDIRFGSDDWELTARVLSGGINVRCSAQCFRGGGGETTRKNGCGF